MLRRTTAIALLIGAGLATAAAAQMMPAGPGPMDMAENFAAMDADGDGKVTRAEAEAWRAARFQAADTNADGLLDRAELVAAARARIEARMAERARQAAEVMAGRMMARHDTDGSGTLSAEEQAAPVPMRMFERLDRDGDGAISTAEMEAAAARMDRRMGRRHPGRDDDGPRWQDDDQGPRWRDREDRPHDRTMRRFEERGDGE